MGCLKVPESWCSGLIRREECVRAMFLRNNIFENEHTNSRNLSISQKIIHNVIWPQMTQFVKQATV
ncbi:hypothetical protein NC652_012391 [Populus alba x Populus x berolinensis]|nr:hypothetical protein NC652_012391 [Populus alba x Populus x berolinensis]